ncbi:MAG: DUF4388 domain-containing protein [Desulfobacteraceae bacterium]|nr:MAG: DUF4388 domain-containing protein [Desulfobacteraceae bacterium]
MFAGSLKTFSLTSLMQICNNDSRNGAVEFINNGSVYGKIGFENGNVVYGEYLGSRGVDSVKQISLLQELDFKFNERILLPEKNIETDINFLLIDCSRYIDESKEYLGKIRAMFDRKYEISQAHFYEYRHMYFKSPELFDIRYLEFYDEDDFIVIYLDKNINARIELVFRKKILTDDLILFMESKEVF